MRIEVRLYFNLREHAPENKTPIFMDLKEGETLASLLACLKIEAEQDLVMLVNGRPATPDAGLNDGDVVTVFPPLGGG